MTVESKDEKPHILSDEEIMELKNKHGVVLFYMNHCFHCNVMKPNWNKVVKELKENQHNSKDFVLGAIETADMDRFNKSGLKQNVNGYPTILYFPKGMSAPADIYQGDRSYEDLKKWIQNKMNKDKQKDSNKLDKNAKNIQHGGKKRRSYRKKYTIRKNHRKHRKHRKITYRRRK